MNSFIRPCGAALFGGGVLLVVTNAFLTPMLPTALGDAATRSSTIYLLRMSASGASAFFLLIGSVGLYLAHRREAGVFGAIAFAMTFLGNSLLVAVEWSNVFVLRALALVNPGALSALDESPLMTIGFASAASAFALGWLLLAISLLRAKIIPVWQPLSVLAGLIMIPLLAATPLGMAGAVIGNAVFGIGLAAVGYSVWRL